MGLEQVMNDIEMSNGADMDMEIEEMELQRINYEQMEEVRQTKNFQNIPKEHLEWV